MPARPQVRYFDSRGGYYCQIARKQHLLAKGPNDAPNGPTYTAALKKFRQLTAGPEQVTFADLVLLYVDHLRAHRSVATADVGQRILDTVAAAFGDAEARGITGRELLAWADARIAAGQWATSTARVVLVRTLACIRWGAREGKIPSCSLVPIELPEEMGRGLECVLQPGQDDAVLGRAPGPLRELLTVLRDTGARPGEIRRAQAKHFDADLGALIFRGGKRARGEHHKTSRRTKRDRVIYLHGASLEIVRRLVQRYPTGPLFRTRYKRRKGLHAGERWAWKAGSLEAALRRLRLRLNLPHLIAYSFRHTFAVRWLRAGKSALALCEVLATSMERLKENYGHLADQHDYLRRLVEAPQ